jgi:hypothetical protein
MESLGVVTRTMMTSTKLQSCIISSYARFAAMQCIARTSLSDTTRHASVVAGTIARWTSACKVIYRTTWKRPMTIDGCAYGQMPSPLHRFALGKPRMDTSASSPVLR